MFDGIELGLMPVASRSVSQSLLGSDYTEALGGKWFAWFTAALMLGAAVGGTFLGNLGDRIGRARAMGVSILFYSLFAGMGAFVTTSEQMLILRFMVGLGVGGERLESEGYGDQHPVASNSTEEGRARNRRIALHVE